MAKERKKRQARQSSIDTSQLKSYGGDFKSRGEQRLAFSKRVKDEAEDIQEQIFQEQEKAQKKSLWSSVGGALGGLALGLATGGLGWVAAGIGAGLGTYGGAHAGKIAAEKKLGKRKTIKSDMFYESEAEKQNLAFRDFDKKLDESILNRSLAAGVMSAAFAGGGELVKSLKEKKNLKDAAVTAQQVETGTKVKKAAEGADFVMQTNLGKTTTDVGKATSNLSSGSGLSSDISVASGYDDIIMDKTLGTESYRISDALAESAGFGGDEILVDNLSLKQSSDITSSFANSLTPLTDEAAPSILDSYFEGLAQQKSKSMQQGLMFAGASSLYGYRPELQSLRQVQFGNKIKPYG
jgi:hypothetical protein